MIRIGSAQSDGATQHGRTSIRNPQVLDGFSDFLMKRLGNVRTEMSLHVLSYNMKPVMKILSVPGLLQAMRLKPEEEDTLSAPDVAPRAIIRFS